MSRFAEQVMSLWRRSACRPRRTHCKALRAAAMHLHPSSALRPNTWCACRQVALTSRQVGGLGAAGRLHVQVVAEAHPAGGVGDVHPQAQGAVRPPLHRQPVVDLRGGRVIDGEHAVRCQVGAPVRIEVRRRRRPQLRGRLLGHPTTGCLSNLLLSISQGLLLWADILPRYRLVNGSQQVVGCTVAVSCPSTACG